jgi:hypothetical protein
MNITASVFSEVPNCWGLKGDSFLWEEMKKHFSKTAEMPSERRFLDELYHAFKMLTGRSANSAHIFYMDRYEGEHITSGMVDPRSWDRVVFPMLISRFRGMRVNNT